MTSQRGATATADSPTAVAIGIDFGTSYSSVGIYRNGKFEIVANEAGNHRIPSVVAFTDKARLVGEEALAQADIDPANCVLEVKRVLGHYNPKPASSKPPPSERRLVQVQFKGETKCYHPEEICGIILAHLRAMAVRQLGPGYVVSGAVIAVPAQFSDGQRQAVLDAATIAGLTVLRLINEPTAAALSFGINKQVIGEQCVLVCSFGGGFLDVSILTIYNGVFQVKASSGDTHLGGVDIDNRLVEYLVKQMAPDGGANTISEDRVAMRKIRKVCEQAKRTLSYTSQVSIELDQLVGGHRFSTTLTKDLLYELCKDLFERVLLHVETALRRARKDRFAVHEIMLVGESSRIPRVQIMLSEFFDRRSLASSVNSDEAVVVGTAIAAAILSGDKSSAIQDVLWWDLVPRSIGLIGENEGEPPRILISRNSTLPLKVRHRVKNYRGVQRLYEGESAIVEDNVTLGQLRLEGSFGDIEDVGLSFSVDLNGVLHVMVEGNIELKATLDKGRLERYEIDRIVYEHKRLLLEMERDEQEEQKLRKQKQHEEKNNSKTPPSLVASDETALVGTWDRFSEWLHCICIVTFDLELGQAMELIYPKHVTLTEQEKMNICYLAFPDSNSGCMGDSQFHIRLRVSSGSENSTLPRGLQEFNCHCMPVHRADPGHFWGFVYFRQIKDSSLKRGYFQKSVVLLTRLPFVNLFYELSAVVAPAYFETGEPTLESVCDSICRWPSLLSDEMLPLQLLGNVYEVTIPKQTGKYAIVPETLTSTSGGGRAGSGTTHRVIASVHEIDIFRSLQLFLPHIHLLWELVLTGEPIIVTGTSPTDCAHMVQSLTSLISPLAYCAESRPYFTIHDTEFKEFTQSKNGHPSIILGVTNPFFAKTLQHWPHTIRLQDSTEAQLQRQQQQQQKHQQHQHQSQPSTAAAASKGGNSNIPSAPYGGGDGSATLSRLSKIKQITHKLLDSSPGLYTQYKPFVQKDKAFIKKILLGLKTERPVSVQSALLRRHLLELTQSFMIPLERYMASLMPLQKDISPFRSAPQPNPFRQEDFLATLDECGPQLTSTCRGDWEGLYRRFFSSPNFKGWYEARYFELEQTLQVLHMQTLSEANLAEWAKGKLEVEIVDMILRLRHKLALCSGSGGGGGGSSNHIAALPVQLNAKETRAQLLRHMENMKKSLPDDLKQILGDA